MIKIKTLLSLAIGLAPLTAFLEPTTGAAPRWATTTGSGSDQVAITKHNAACVNNAPRFAESVIAKTASFASTICPMEGRTIG